MTARDELPVKDSKTRTETGYIGKSEPRANAKRLLQGRGSFIDDLRFARLAHVAFLRSPHAHAKIRSMDFSKARTAPGVIGVYDGRAVAEYCSPWIGVLGHLKGIKSPPQYPLAIERACWQGEAVAAVVAESRAQAEDAVELIAAEWDPLPAVIDMHESLAGKVVRVEPTSDAITEERIAKVAFDRVVDGVSTGEMAEVTLRLPAVLNAVTIPNASLRHRGAQAGVWLHEDGQLRFVPVKTGAEGLDGMVQIIEGLVAGDEVVVYSERDLNAGSRITVVPALRGAAK